LNPQVARALVPAASPDVAHDLSCRPEIYLGLFILTPWSPDFRRQKAEMNLGPAR